MGDTLMAACNVTVKTKLKGARKLKRALKKIGKKANKAAKAIERFTKAQAEMQTFPELNINLEVKT